MVIEVDDAFQLVFRTDRQSERGIGVAPVRSLIILTQL
jgi:hypothetical protein